MSHENGLFGQSHCSSGGGAPEHSPSPPGAHGWPAGLRCSRSARGARPPGRPVPSEARSAAGAAPLGAALQSPRTLPGLEAVKATGGRSPQASALPTPVRGRAPAVAAELCGPDACHFGKPGRERPRLPAALLENESNLPREGTATFRAHEAPEPRLDPGCWTLPASRVFVTLDSAMHAYLVANHSNAGGTSWNVPLPTAPAPWCLDKQVGSPPTAQCWGRRKRNKGAELQSLELVSENFPATVLKL